MHQPFRSILSWSECTQLHIDYVRCWVLGSGSCVRRIVLRKIHWSQNWQRFVTVLAAYVLTDQIYIRAPWRMNGANANTRALCRWCSSFRSLQEEDDGARGKSMVGSAVEREWLQRRKSLYGSILMRHMTKLVPLRAHLALPEKEKISWQERTVS